jgi:molecular chaperone DnaJ
VFVHVKQNEKFSRDGDDLWCDVPVGFAQAALGADITVPGLKTEELLHIPPGTQTGTVFKISRQGLPRLGNPASRGALNVRVNVVVPTHLSHREREILHMWAEMRQENVLPEDKSILRKVKDALGR